MPASARGSAVISLVRRTGGTSGVAGTVELFVLGGERLQAPDLKTRADDGEVAWDSTPLLARLRDKKADREIA
jgi:hypothetical protein